MGAPYTSAAVANALLEIAEQIDGKRLTNLVLQKLVYFAHGWYLGIAEKSLVADTCEAWRYGPVFPGLYEKLRKYGAGEVTEQIETSSVVEKDSEDYNFLKILYQKYKDFTPSQLIATAHVTGSPWDKTIQRASNENKYKSVIDVEDIKAYFAAL